MCDFGFPPIPLNRSFLDILYLSDFLDSLYLVRQEVGSVRSESGILTRAGAAPREPHQLAGTRRGILTIIFPPPTTDIAADWVYTIHSLSYNFWRVVSDQTINQRGGWLLIFLHWIDCMLFSPHSISMVTCMHLRWLYSYGLMVCQALGQYLSLFEA